MKKNFFILIFLLYLALHFFLAFYLFGHNLYFQINNDGRAYFDSALQIYQGRGIVKGIWWPPLFPVFLSPFLFFSSQSLLFFSFFESLIFGLLLYLLYKALGTIKAGKNQSLITLVFFALLPANLVITKLPIAETFCLTFLALHFFSFITFLRKKRLWNFALSIFFLTVASFIKPTTMYLGYLETLVFLPFVFRFGKPFLPKVITYLSIGIVLPFSIYSLWSFRNFRLTQVYTFANVKNYNLLTHNFFHAYPYITSFLKTDLPVKIPIGAEFKMQEADDFRHYLFGDFLNGYLLSKYGLTIDKISFEKRVFYAGELGSNLIKKYFFLYFPLHFLKSFALFFPNDWEFLRFLIDPQLVKLFFFLNIVCGIILLALFLYKTVCFIRRLREIKFKNLKISDWFSAYLFLILAYFLVVVGPTAIDTGGRFQFIFFFFLLIFLNLRFGKKNTTMNLYE